MGGPDRKCGEQGDDEIRELGGRQAIEKLVFKVYVERDASGHVAKLGRRRPIWNSGC